MNIEQIFKYVKGLNKSDLKSDYSKMGLKGTGKLIIKNHYFTTAPSQFLANICTDLIFLFFHKN
jgi:hypothetical protein